MPVECLAEAEPHCGHDWAGALLDWYDTHARQLPWRAPPGAPPSDPYLVWLAEIMLQQTTVATVTPRFLEFRERWPSIEALAASEPEALMSAWAGLGYYARARSLHACARAVVAQGGFPRTADELRLLPGVGPYTAAAIAALAFGEPAAVVDTNVERVVARLLALRTPRPALAGDVRARLQPRVPADRPGDFAQALMDLGATICRPGAPDCHRCPLARACAARALGQQDQFPVRAERPTRRLAHGTAWWIEVDGRVGLERRPARGLLGGMLGVPGTAFAAESEPALPFGGPWHRAQTPVRHLFTHIDLRLHVAAIRLTRPPEWPPHLSWTPRDDLSGLPSLYRKVAQVAGALLEE